MSQTDLLKRAATLLDRLGIPFMLTGSMASSLQGEPRATHDIDLVIDLSPEKIDALFQSFPTDEFYLSRPAIEEAVQARGMFNVLNLHEGDKIDFWLLTDEPFDQSRFARRQHYNVDGVDVAVSSPEDTLLMKLKWSQQAGGSQVQLRDAQHIYDLHGASLDRTYLDAWVKALNLSELWKQLTRGSGFGAGG